MSFRKLFFVAAAVAMMFALTGCPGGGNGVPRPYTAVVYYPDGEAEVTVQRGGSQQFRAAITPAGAVQYVIWALEGEDLAAQGVAINAYGLLTVATATPPTAAVTFTVRATAVGHSTVYGTRTVNVPAVTVAPPPPPPPPPTPASVTITGTDVSPGAEAGQFVLSLEVGASVTLDSSVSPTAAPQDVTWAVTAGFDDVVEWNGEARILTAIAHGEATVTATATGTAVSGTLTVTVVPPGGFAELQNAVNEANSLVDAATIRTDGLDVPPAQQWVTQTAVDEFELAIAAAEAVLADDDATQEDRVDALAALLLARGAFVGAKSPGAPLNAGELEDAIGDAEDLLDTAVGSADGLDVAPADRWVPVAYRAALVAAIDYAEALLDSADATRAQVLAAIAAIAAAMDDFEDASEYGATLNRGALDTLITNAETLRDATVVNTAAANVPVGTFWATQEHMDTFQAAIAAAGADHATQAAINAAFLTLQGAYDTFYGQRQAGVQILTDITIRLRDFIDAANYIEIDGVDGIGDSVTRSEGVRFILDSEDFEITDVWWVRGINTSQTLDFALSGSQLDLGTNSLTLVVRIDGRFYSRTITFRVVE